MDQAVLQPFGGQGFVDQRGEIAATPVAAVAALRRPPAELTAHTLARNGDEVSHAFIRIQLAPGRVALDVRYRSVIGRIGLLMEPAVELLEVTERAEEESVHLGPAVEQFAITAAAVVLGQS